MSHQSFGWGWSDSPDRVPDEFAYTVERANILEVIRLAEVQQYNVTHDRTEERVPIRRTQAQVAIDAVLLGKAVTSVMSVTSDTWRASAATYEDHLTNPGQTLSRFLVRVGSTDGIVVPSSLPFPAGERL